MREELDHPGEWHYAPDERELYFWPNTTSTGTRGAGEGAAGPGDLVVPMLRTLVNIQGSGSSKESMAHTIAFKGVGFRDSKATYMAKEWSAPSGGDWSLYHGGAVQISRASDITLNACVFRRLDGNAVYLSGRTRNVEISESTFEWLGENAITTNGDSDKWDARGGNQPRGTNVVGNVIHDVGLYEKQSSGWGQNKACLATVSKNIMYNLPRAASKTHIIV